MTLTGAALELARGLRAMGWSFEEHEQEGVRWHAYIASNGYEIRLLGSRALCITVSGVSRFGVGRPYADALRWAQEVCGGG